FVVDPPSPVCRRIAADEAAHEREQAGGIVRETAAARERGIAQDSAALEARARTGVVESGAAARRRVRDEERSHERRLSRVVDAPARARRVALDDAILEAGAATHDGDSAAVERGVALEPRIEDERL